MKKITDMAIRFNPDFLGNLSFGISFSAFEKSSWDVSIDNELFEFLPLLRYIGIRFLMESKIKMFIVVRYTKGMTPVMINLVQIW